MKGWWRLVVLGPCVGWAAHAQAFETDARSAARGGLWVLGRIEDSPGCQPGRDWEVALDVGLPYVGLDLETGAVRIERNGRRLRGACSLGQLRTPIGNETAFGLALGCRWHAWSAGGALRARLLALDETSPAWTASVKYGMGFAVGERFFACSLVELAPSETATTGGALGIEFELHDAVRGAAQVVHTVGLGSAVRIGIECGAGAVRWLAGFDPNTLSVSLGLAWHDARQGIAWGARTHPALGWSHWWTYACGSAAPDS